MPKPTTIEKRDKSKQALRHLEPLLDDDKFLDAADEIEDSDDAARRARGDPTGYFKEKGVKIPPGLEIVEVEHGSPFKICVTWRAITVCVSW